MYNNSIIDVHTHRSENASSGIVCHSLAGTDPLRDDACYSVGIHPWDACRADALWPRLESLCRNPRVVAIGEAGLDKLADGFPTPQLSVFRRQAALSEAVGLPLLIHCVKAADELLAVRKELRPQMPWVWHGFRGKSRQALQLLHAGLYLSFGLHFSEESLNSVPDERLFLETDESDISIDELLQQVACVRRTDVAHLRGVLRQNVEHLFFTPRGVVY